MVNLKFKHVTTRGELDQLEQAGITEGLKWLDKQKNPDVLSEAFVLELRKRLFGSVWKWAGTFRRHSRIMADAILTKILNEPAIDWAGGYRLETMNERRDQYIAALRDADEHDISALLEFVGA